MLVMFLKTKQNSLVTELHRIKEKLFIKMINLLLRSFIALAPSRGRQARNIPAGKDETKMTNYGYLPSLPRYHGVLFFLPQRLLDPVLGTLQIL